MTTKITPGHQVAYPAVLTMHCPSGTTNACARHARTIQNLFGGMWGMRIASTPAPDGAQCDNCVNEAKAKARSA